jgi:sugar diacid utilization regulator
MQITSSILFYLLEKKYNITYLSGGSGSIVAAPRLLDTDSPEADFLYITGNPDDLLRIKRPASCSFLLTGLAADYAIPDQLQGFDIACVNEPAPMVKILQDVYNLILAFVNWDNSMNNACVEGAEYARLFQIIRELFPLPAVVHDQNFRIIAHTQDYFEFIHDTRADREYIPNEVVSEVIMQEGDVHKLFEHRESYVYPPYPCEDRWLCSNFYSGNHFECRFIAAYDQSSPNVSGQLELLTLCCGYTGRIFINKSGKLIDKRQEDDLHELLRSFISKSKDVAEQEIGPIIKEVDWKMGDQFRVVVFYISDAMEFTNASSYLCRQLEADIALSCAVIMNPHIVWVINDQFQGNSRNKFGDYLKAIPYFVREFNCKAGISNMVDSFLALRDAYTQAVVALRFGEMKDPHLWRHNFSDHTMEYICERLTSEVSVENMLHPGVTALMDYDKKSGTEYLKTIRYFADARYNMTLAASKLPVHRLTFLRRLEKIREISNINFDDPDELLHVHLSIKLLNLA